MITDSFYLVHESWLCHLSRLPVSLVAWSIDQVMSLLITKSIKAAVTTYVDATAGINMYDDMVSSLAKREHRDVVTDMVSRTTAAFCRWEGVSGTEGKAIESVEKEQQ